MNLVILSPEKEIFAGEVKSVIVPGSEGQGYLGVEMWTLDEMRGPRGRLP